jgi:hypothetical protein
MQRSKKKLSLLCAAVPLAYYANAASAGVNIYGTTAFQNGTAGGYTASTGTGPSAGGPNSVSAGGYEVGNANYYLSAPAGAGGGNRYSTGYILTSPGTTTNLGVPSGAPAPTAGGASPDTASSINTSGTLIAGYADSYTYTNASGVSTLSNVETVWTNSGAPIALPVAVTDTPGTGPADTTGLINNSGTVVGFGTIYNANDTTANPRISLGTGSFVWTNSGTVASPSYTSYAELVSPSNSTGSLATGSRTENVFGISDTGLAVGAGSQYNGSVSAGNVAVTWDTTSTPTTTPGLVQKTIAPVLLTSPSLSSAGSFGGSGNYTYNSASGSGTGTVAAITTSSQASYVNALNVIAGSATVYDANTANAGTGRYTAIGSEPILWKGAGSTGTFLPLATNYTTGNVTGLDAGGDVLGNIQGTGLASGVVWKAGSSAPTMLAVPTGINPVTGAAYTGYTFSKGINDEGYSVGLLGSSTGSSSTGYAMLWDPNGNATDLDSMITLVPGGSGSAAGWVSLLVADGISDDGYISGVGVYYDPNATNYSTGALPAAGEYYRPFLIQDTAAVPEPVGLAGVILAVGSMTLRRRHRRPGSDIA